MTICFEIPGQPVPQARARRSANGGMFTPPKSAAYRKKCIAACYEAYRGTPLKGHCSLLIRVVKQAPKTTLTKLARVAIAEGHLIPCATRPDADNYLKQISDAVSGIIVKDDAQFWRVACEKYIGNRPRIEVIITEWNVRYC